MCCHITYSLRGTRFAGYNYIPTYDPLSGLYNLSCQRPCLFTFSDFALARRLKLKAKVDIPILPVN